MLCFERLKLWDITFAFTRDVAVGLSVIDGDADMDSVTSILNVFQIGELRRVCSGVFDSDENTNLEFKNWTNMKVFCVGLIE